MHSIQWIGTIDADTHPDAGASEPNESNDSDEAHEPKVRALGPTLNSLDSFDALDSDQGRNRMNLMNRKWHPGLWIQTPPPIHVPRILMHLMDLMHLKSWPWGHFGSFDSDQGPNLMNVNESKVAPRTLDSDTTPDAFASDSDRS